MKHTIKTISFVILILSLGLVLSACNKENQEIENNGEAISSKEADKHEPFQQEDQEDDLSATKSPAGDLVSGKEEKNIIDLDVSKWRTYENEYFNLKFKYHNNWYFQRDNLNAENYIAVYGFSPSAEELNNKDYAIQLFILNSVDNFTEDFTYSKEKESGDKKYILASNQEEVKDVLNLMFENLEFLDKETSEDVEEMNSNTYINEGLGLQFEYPEGWIVREENTDYNNRIYIENQINKNYNIGNYPEDFLSMWIDYREPSPKTFSYQKQIENYNELSAKKELLEIGLLDIYTYEFAYNPNSERSGVGPYLVAIWEKSPYIYNFRTMDSSNKDNNKTKVSVLKQILSTFKFTK